jgi:hypothetical protein
MHNIHVTTLSMILNWLAFTCFVISIALSIVFKGRQDRLAIVINVIYVIGWILFLVTFLFLYVL